VLLNELISSGLPIGGDDRKRSGKRSPSGSTVAFAREGASLGVAALLLLEQQSRVCGSLGGRSITVANDDNEAFAPQLRSLRRAWCRAPESSPQFEVLALSDGQGATELG